MDLIRILKNHITVALVQEVDIDKILGAGIRAYLAGDYARANTLFSQAFTIESNLCNSLEVFWNKMRESKSTGLADNLMNQITILEKHEEFSLPKHDDRKGNFFDWSVEISAPDEVLDLVDFVQYELHHTFKQPVQVVRNREDNFRLVRRGWHLEL